MPLPCTVRPATGLDDAGSHEHDLLRAARRHRGRLIPKDLPPRSITYCYFSRWRDKGLFDRITHHLVMADRERVGRAASPTAAVLDSQSVKTSESGGPRGYDAGKKVLGRKRQALVDTDGRALVLDLQSADVQDRDGAVPVLRLSRRTFPFIAKAFADAGYAGGPALLHLRLLPTESNSNRGRFRGQRHHRPPEALDEHIVHPPFAAIHGDPDATPQQHLGEARAEELAALVGIEKPGRPNWNKASSGISMQKSASMELLNRQDRALRLCRSMMATRYRSLRPTSCPGSWQMADHLPRSGARRLEELAPDFPHDDEGLGNCVVHARTICCPFRVIALMMTRSCRATTMRMVLGALPWRV